MLYQDPSAELVAYIYPHAQKNEEDYLRKAMMFSYKTKPNFAVEDEKAISAPPVVKFDAPAAVPPAPTPAPAPAK